MSQKSLLIIELFYNKIPNTSLVNVFQKNMTIIVKAFDDTFSQIVYARESYKYYEILSGVKFVPNFTNDASGATVLYLDKLNDHIEAKLNWH